MKQQLMANWAAFWSGFWEGLGNPWLLLYAMLVMLILVLAACATTAQVTTYTHASKTKAEFDADLYACNQDAALYTQGGAATDPWGAVALALTRRGDHAGRFYQCMTKARGWQADAPKQTGKAHYGGAAP